MGIQSTETDMFLNLDERKKQRILGAAIEEFADAIKFAVEMPEDEKQKRMQEMQSYIRENNIYRW